MTDKIKELQEVINHQANIETLWSEPMGRLPTMDEHLLRCALRHIHAVLEDDLGTAQLMKHEYWNLESEM